MKIDDGHSGPYRTPLAGPPMGVFGKLLTIAAGIVVLVVAFMFSIVALGVILVVGVLIFAYLKWKTRNLPRDLRDLHERMQEQAARQGGNRTPPAGGRVIEGEVISDAEYRSSTQSGSTDGNSNGGPRGPAGHSPG